MDYRQLAYQKAVKYGLDPDLFVRQIEAESAFNPNAVSSAGAIGLGQLMPATARELGVDPSDPDQNLEGAARYMRQQMDKFGRPDLALAAYNAGPSRVAKLGRVPNITETQNYVAKIMGTSPAMRLSTKDAPMTPTMTPTAKPEEQQSLWGRLTGRSEATGLNPLQAFAAGLDALILPELRMGEAIRQQGAQRAKTARTEKQANQTIKYLTGIGRDDLAKAVGTGAIDPASAIKVAITGATEKDTALIRQALAAGLKQGTPEFQQYILSGGDIYSQETKLLASLPQPEKGMRYQFDRDENGKITNYRLVPIEGGSAAVEAEQLQVAEKARKEDQLQKDYTFFGAGERVINAIDKDPTLIPKTGIIAGMIADTPFGQKQKDVAEDLAIMESQMQFETLADLKRASPTGASGLGQLTDAERRALGKIEQNFSNLQGEDAIKRTIRSASLMRTYMKNGIKDAKTGEYRNATDAEVEMMVQGINPFGPDSGAILEGLPSGIFPSGKPTQDGASSQSTTKRMKFDSQGNMVN